MRSTESEPSTASLPNPQPPSSSSGSKKVEKICGKCNLVIHGQFVRAVNSHFHLACFTCHDCQKNVAEKFFPANDKTTGKSLIFCETDYFKRLDLLCARCGLALRGPYIKVGKNKYHMEHFSCAVCSTVFKQHDSYYEKDDKIYCATHFSVMYAARCGGCNCAVLKNFVETTKDEKVTQWHPCCYILSKLWNVKMAESVAAKSIAAKDDPDYEVNAQKNTIEKVERILQVLSGFEESTAGCISEMLARFTNENFREGAYHARRLVYHVDILFSNLEAIDVKLNSYKDPKDYAKSKDVKSFIVKITTLFKLLSDKKTPEERQNATSDVIKLVTGLAHLLKVVIRLCLSGAVRLEQAHNDREILEVLLNALKSCSSADDNSLMVAALSISDENLACSACKIPIEEECIKAVTDSYKWHEKCFKCSNCNVQFDRTREGFYEPSTGALLCLKHKTSTCVSSHTKVHQLSQYAFMLNAALNDFFKVLQVSQNDILDPTPDKGEGTPLAATPEPQPEKKEEFFDDEEPSPVTSLVPATPISEMGNRSRASGIDVKSFQSIDERYPFLTDASGLEVLATRQLAALALHRHLQNWFTLTELLQIAAGPKRTVWSRMFGGGSKEKKIPDKTFGAPLQWLCENYGVDSDYGFGVGKVRIPNIVHQCISHIKKCGMLTEGIFRKNGNIRRLKDQCQMFDDNPGNISFQEDSEIQVAALLKKFLRDLPEPLMTEALFKLFLCVPKLERKEDQVPVIQLLMCLLPKENIDLLSVLVRFFIEVGSYAEVPEGNKMDLSNLACVIAPNILYTRLDDVERSAIVIEIVKTLFLRESSIFRVPPAIKDSLASAEDELSGDFIKKYEQRIKSVHRQVEISPGH